MEALLKWIFLGMLLLQHVAVNAQEVECPGGFSLHGTNCYIYLQEHYTWFEGQVACGSMGARLVEIETPEENNFIGGLVQSHGDTYAWTGMADFAEEGVFISPSTHQTVPQTYWAPGEPNDRYTNGESEDCVFIDGRSQWWDASCHGYREPVICEMPYGDQESAIIG